MTIPFTKSAKLFLVALTIMVLAILLTPGYSPAPISYYVDPVGGLDGNTGGAGDPWKTIHWAITQIAADDILILKDGTYSIANEADAVLNVSLANVTIRAENPGGAIIDGIGALTWVNAFNVTSSGVTIKDLVIKRFMGGGLFISGGSGHTIMGNELYDNGTSGGGAYGITLTGGVSNSNVKDNTVYWSGDTNYRQYYGMTISGAGSALNVTDNLVYDHDDATGVGFKVTDSPVNISLNNIRDNRVGVAVEDSVGATAMIWNNIIFKSAGTVDTGVLVKMISAGASTPQVYHNTIDGGAFYGVRVENSGANPTVYYNMITNFSAGAGISVVTGAAPGLRYNNLFGNGTNHSGIAAGTGDASLSPGYVGGADYHLQASSPAIGLIPPAESDPVSADFDGVPRPAGTFRDPGAYEYPAGCGGGGALNVSLSFSPGSTIQQYVIRAMPLSLADPTPSVAIGSQIGVYNTTLMRIGHWDSDLQVYMEYPDEDGDIHPGDAAWFLFRNGATLNFSGTETPTTPDPKDSQCAAPIYLHVGWNQVGNPFNHPVAISNMVVSNTDGTPGPEDLTAGNLTQGIFWIYNNGEYYAATKLNVGEGGWIKKLDEEGMLWVKDISVPYPDPAEGASGDDKGYQSAPDSADRPPAPPSGMDSGWGSSGGGGGGGGGGCFVNAVE